MTAGSSRAARPLQPTGGRTAMDLGNRHQSLVGIARALLALDARVVLHPPGTDPHQLPKPAVRPYPSQYVSSWVMKNGAEVTLRPIRPEDEPLMVKFHETLSDRSVYLRYFYSLSLSSRVAHDRLVRICFVDYDREMAIVAESQGCQDRSASHPRSRQAGQIPCQERRGSCRADIGCVPEPGPGNRNCSVGSYRSHETRS